MLCVQRTSRCATLQADLIVLERNGTLTCQLHCIHSCQSLSRISTPASCIAQQLTWWDGAHTLSCEGAAGTGDDCPLCEVRSRPCRGREPMDLKSTHAMAAHSPAGKLVVKASSKNVLPGKISNNFPYGSAKAQLHSTLALH